MKEPIWLSTARRHIGQKEIAGIKSNEWILSLWETVPWIWSTVAGKDDSLLPWCGAFMNKVMLMCGIESPKKWWSAARWADWGTPLKKPVLGCIAIKKRKGGAHVTILCGRDNAGNYIGIGGNQGDSVKLSAFKPAEFTSYVWPKNWPIGVTPLPLLSAEAIESEA